MMWNLTLVGFLEEKRTNQNFQGPKAPLEVKGLNRTIFYKDHGLLH